MSARRIYVSECLLLMAVATPLALAEWSLIYAGLCVIGALIGWRRTIEQDRPLLEASGSRIVVVLAFFYLISEYFRENAISVIALSHFMIVVCLTKLVQRRSYRDHAQFFVLTLLLLVVAAIVSGNLLFPIALAVYLTVGLDALVRFHLDVEQARAEQHNRRIDWSHAIFPAGLPREPGTTRFTISLALASSLTGALIFVACPRLAANSIFPRFDSPRMGHSVSGFTNTLNFHTIGQISESDRPVMRVQLEIDGAPAGELERGPYFRGLVLTRYRCDQPGSLNGEWQWKTSGSSTGMGVMVPRGDDEGYFELLTDAPVGDRKRVLVQNYYLEPSGETLNLFTCFPPVRLRCDSQSVDEVKKWVEDQTVQLSRPINKQIRYTVESPVAMSPYLTQVLADERVRKGHEAEPDPVQPDPLPRAGEIMRLTAPLRAGLDPLETAENRLTFARRLRDFLQSGEFKYTLKPPRFPRGVEPIGEFLLEKKLGHCEYFASAMAVICQLHGIPARVVAGYCGGDYNPVGEFYLVRARHAHSWVELFVPGQDWVRFDPTPAAPGIASQSNPYLRMLGRYLDYLQFQWANLVVSYDADQRRSLFDQFSAWVLRPTQNENTVLGAVSAFIRELFGWRLKLNWEERLIYWVFALLMLTLILLIGYVVAVALRWAIVRAAAYYLNRGSPPTPPELEFYARFCRYLESHRITRSSGQTPAELAGELAARWPDFEPAPALVNAYYAVAFGDRRLTPPERNAIEQFLSQLAATAHPLERAGSGSVQ